MQKHIASAMRASVIAHPQSMIVPSQSSTPETGMSSSTTSERRRRRIDGCRFDCVERPLSRLFGRYIRVVTSNPWPFIIGPCIITLISLFGFVRNPPLVKDELSLYTPINAPARDEVKVMEQYFRISDEDPFYAERRFDSIRSGYIIMSKGGPHGNVLTRSSLGECVSLWRLLNDIVVVYEGRAYNYHDLCVRVNFQVNGTTTTSTCVANPIIAQYASIASASAGGAGLDAFIDTIRYPTTSRGTPIGHMIGGVLVDDNNHFITQASAIRLPYMLRHQNWTTNDIGGLWEARLTVVLNESPLVNQSASSIAWWTSETLAEESAKDRDRLLQLLLPLFVVLTSFTVLCCLDTSVVSSRPWLGVGGVLSAGLAILSSIGMLLLFDYSFTSVAYSMPFIIYSIGVDNVFILLSAWRTTDIRLPLLDRMSHTFSDAGVSITVTSLTDGFSFGAGCLATFPSVRIFCVYATTAIGFVFLYQVTFFAAIMAITGRREVEGRSCLTFKKVAVITKVKTKDIGRPSHSIPTQRDDGWSLANFFGGTYANLLLHPVIIVFIAYLLSAVYGVTQLKLGLRPVDLLPDGSYGEQALIAQDEYLKDYGVYLHVSITNLSRTLQYSEEPWNDLQREIRLFEHTEYTGYADSWLRVFLAYVSTQNVTLSKATFVPMVKDHFLAQSVYAKFAHDIRFDGTGTKIDAVRIPVLTRNIDLDHQPDAMHLFRRLAEASRLQVTVYADFFLFAEQYDAALPGTLTNVGAAAAAVIVVSLLLIPRPGAALYVSVTILSINVGILGYMALWGVRLDFVSMVTIVMSIGFCVDFSAHIAYHFAKEAHRKVEDRLRASLFAVGTPILQSAVSTIIGVTFLLLVDSYVYQSFLKTVVLVVGLGIFHGLVVLPVMLTLLSCESNTQGDTDEHSQGTGSTGDVHRHSFYDDGVWAIKQPSPPPAYEYTPEHLVIPRDTRAQNPTITRDTPTQHGYRHRSTAGRAMPFSYTGAAFQPSFPSRAPMPLPKSLSAADLKAVLQAQRAQAANPLNRL